MKGRQRAKRSQKGLLDQVFFVAGCAKRRADSPNRWLGGANEFGESDVVALEGRIGQYSKMLARSHGLDTCGVKECQPSRGNSLVTWYDLWCMKCERWRDAISASIDGEPGELDSELVAAHLKRCADCRGFQAFAENSRRVVRISEAPAMPDLAPKIVKLNAVADRLSRWSLARAALAVVAIEVIVLAIPDLLLANGDVASVHATRHLGAFSAAYGVALLVVVLRPGRARAVLPVAMVLGATLLITSIIDVIDAKAPLLGEARHLPELISVLLIWLLAVPTPRRRLRRGAMPSVREPLRAVDDDRRTG